MSKKNMILIVIVLGFVIGVYNTLFFVEQKNTSYSSSVWRASKK